jgi:hypothetical protein
MTGFFVAYLLRLLQFRSAWSLRILSSTNSRGHKRISKAMIDNAFDSGEEVGVCLEGAIVGLTHASSPAH